MLLDVIQRNRERYKRKYKNIDKGLDVVYEQKPRCTKRRKKQKKKFSYQAYIKSSKWRRKAFHKKRKVGACETCGCQKNLTVHHLNYKNLGREQDKDLMVVCWDCHQNRHEDKLQAQHIRSINK